MIKNKKICLNYSKRLYKIKIKPKYKNSYNIMANQVKKTRKKIKKTQFYKQINLKFLKIITLTKIKTRNNFPITTIKFSQINQNKLKIYKSLNKHINYSILKIKMPIKTLIIQALKLMNKMMIFKI